MFKKLLVNCNTTQEELANKLNVTQALVSKWATGKGQPRTKMLSQIANALGVDVSTVVECFSECSEEE